MRDAASGKNACEYPKGSGKYAGGLAAIWTSASDGKDDYVAAQMYRSSGVDFWPGPLDPATGAC
ncbi:MAG TPA: hypothetical protein VL092_04885, partial [Chitinophagaceae bacterium]|nr:hypothetical protein [Chitinophagaceae bacterium]